jgi:hypothetical protein
MNSLSTLKINLSGKEETPNQQIKRMEWSGVLPEKQNQIAVVGRTFSSPPLIANRYVQKYESFIRIQ